MQEYSLLEAQTHLRELITDAIEGKLVIIHDEGEKIVRLVPVNPAKKGRRAGSARGQITLSPDFDAPLADFQDYVE